MLFSAKIFANILQTALKFLFVLWWTTG